MAYGQNRCEKVVDVTIFVEGGVIPSLANPQLTPDSSNLLRESFHTLLSQKINAQEFNLIVIPIGGYLNVPKLFIPEAAKNNNAATLLDFAEPSDNLNKAIRLGVSKYSKLSFDPNDVWAFRDECVLEVGLEGYQERVFFMNRELEAWILSQPDEIERYGEREGFVRKRIGSSIADHTSLKVSHPSIINDPKSALNTIFIQFFDKLKLMNDGKTKPKPREYKAKDGPHLIAMLDLEKLMTTFPDAKNLIEWIINKPYFLIVFGKPILTKRRL